MNFSYVIIYVNDVPASLAFFQRAFDCTVKFLHESNTYGELSTGDATLAFAAHEIAEQNIPGGYEPTSLDRRPWGMEVGFTTLDVAGAYERAVAAGATPISPPMTKPWGQIVSYVRSLDGTLVEICSPVAAR